MRKSFVILILILLTSFSFAQNNENRIYPVDESKSDITISQFVGILEEIITAKDTFRLYNLLDENVVTSFGGAYMGIKSNFYGFCSFWFLRSLQQINIQKIINS